MAEASKTKRIISISLGSSKRDASAELMLGDMRMQVERRGVDGDFAKAKRLMESLDGKVDAIGLGGTDLYVYAGHKRYTFRESQRLIAGVRQTPVLDGSGLKNTLERRLIQSMTTAGYPFAGSKVLMVCAVDRFGMAEALQEAGAKLTCGDLLFGLNVNIPVYSLSALARWASFLAPVLTKLPVSWFYPMGAEQEKKIVRYPEYFLENDIIAGDFHYIKKFMPESLVGKTIITNTVTTSDRQILQRAGVAKLVTTTPCLTGRSFGTNVMEAMLVAAEGAQAQLSPAKYMELLDLYKIESSVENFFTE